MSKKHGPNTKLVHAGRDPDAYYGLANPPVGRASTILYPNLAAYENKEHQYRYGRMGNPSSAAFEKAVAELEGGYDAITAPSGLAVISTTLLAFLKSGDHMLASDAMYPPTREFLDSVLTRFDVEVEYYSADIGVDITNHIRDNTAVIYMESPGSATFDILDVSAVMNAIKDQNITTVLDNSWSGGVLFKPFEHGVDVSLQSATKYISGHSDVSIGVAVARDEETFKTLKAGALELGTCIGADDVILALRGMRTMDVRMKRNAENALKVAQWLQTRGEVRKVYHPALPEDDNHALWKRDFSGCNGVVSILLQPAPKAAVNAFVDGLELFPLGSSWGGYESLLQPQYMKHYRSVKPWSEDGFFVRLQIGLEDPEDLIADLEAGFKKFGEAQ